MEKPSETRIIRIRNTFSIDTFTATETLAEDIRKNEALSVIGKPMHTVFNEAHALELGYRASNRKALSTTRK
jgi:hypothetical protein